MVQALTLLARQSHGRPPIGWDEVVVGYDFGLLEPREIQDWALGQPHPGPRCLELEALDGERMAGFEAALWAACAEGAGKVPRPGGRRWARAQDRWRAALLQDALDAPLTPEALAVAVEAIYDRVGCPEDMLGLWRRTSPWQPLPADADRDEVVRFLRQCERDSAANF
jgi:hypothetical protein